MRYGSSRRYALWKPSLRTETRVLAKGWTVLMPSQMIYGSSERCALWKPSLRTETRVLAKGWTVLMPFQMRYGSSKQRSHLRDARLDQTRGQPRLRLHTRRVRQASLRLASLLPPLLRRLLHTPRSRELLPCTQHNKHHPAVARLSSQHRWVSFSCGKQTTGASAAVLSCIHAHAHALPPGKCAGDPDCALSRTAQQRSESAHTHTAPRQHTPTAPRTPD